MIAGLGRGTADATATVPGALATVGTPPEVTAVLAEDLPDHPAGTVRRATRDKRPHTEVVGRPSANSWTGSRRSRARARQ
ncbi:hypothetical protein ACFYW9_02655 [Streptomyces sp. NPDC002698]|uniref:hypothetical protein n=1 Tax=Streptomyces sp. NPDC002698 TaxID=3364660 RepID=UPI00368B6BE2